MSSVLVTGGSGFIASHTIVALLAAGHQVRTTVRNLARADEVRAMVRQGGTDRGGEVAFVVADLMAEAGWPQAVAGCDYVLHVASPFPARAPDREDELIGPARDGTMRVLRAARDAGVKRVVVTSSFAAIGYGHAPRTTPFDETDWTDPSGRDVQPYMKSKTLAERAAWDFVAHAGGRLELAVVNPVAVFGPVLGPDLSTSVTLVKAMLDGAVPATPRIHFGIVDARDVADLHVAAMTHPEAKGERFIAAAGPNLSLQAIAQVLRARLAARARRVPRHDLPDWLVRLLGPWVPTARATVPHLGIIRNATSDKARRVLGWTPRSSEEAIVATAESLIRLEPVRGRRAGA
ncbi:SDR family oxidoreductase [Chelatococcus reniformis]|uniref:Dihydroflavonol-4-reductase n=1 Tax=Chelatococcus reniformis TaxID=1494448 RepID=A0A916U3H8_9HYPH|nr:aldehyde reductase [Chelatococcus reniformis]GGC58689.1 dihydroflavonol-4-reductase [Chelatococcus reniformis]